MLLGTEPLLAAADAPSLWNAALRLGLALGALVAAAWGWFLWQRKGTENKRQLEVMERSFLTRGVSLVLVRVDGRRLLVGVSADGVRLIRELDRVEQVGTGRFEDELEAAMAEATR